MADFAAMAEWYCQMVTNGKVPACRWERLACTRFLHMLQNARKPGNPYVFSADHVTDVCEFIQHLPHTKGFEGLIVLEPVQMWWLAAIFGFRECDTRRRWVREASLWVPRKNAKTALSIGIVLYCTNYEAEPGAEACICAGSEKQADIPYSQVRKTLEITDLLREHLLPDGPLGTGTTELIRFRRTGAELKLLAGRAPNLDGLNPHVVLAEELHAQNQEVIGVLRTAQGARMMPLWLSISTAGRHASGPAYDGWKSDQAVLEGSLRSDRVFVAMYAADEIDLPKRFDPLLIERINPLFGISLQAASLEGEAREAQRSEQKLQEYDRTRLNRWARAAGNLLSVEKWDRCGDAALRLRDFEGLKIYVGLDMASASDLNAACFLTCLDDQVICTFRYWLPMGSPRFDDDRFAEQFIAWREAGNLTVTNGTHVDHTKILADILEEVRDHFVSAFGVDRYQADYLMGQLEKEGHRVFTISKTAKDITRATDDLITRHGDPARLQHDSNPVTAWMAGNVVGHYDANDNVLPKKEKKGSKMSIDGIDAAIMANSARLADEAGMLDAGVKVVEPLVYLKRGLLGA